MRLLCVGEAFTDLIFMGIDRMPLPGEELRTDRFVATVGGGAVITAVAASRLGLRAAVMSALGPDAVARLRAERVSVTNVIRPGERAAVSAAISLPHDRSFVTFDGVNRHLESRLLKRARDMHAPLVHFALAPRACPPWTALVRRLRAAGVVTSWDFGWHEHLAARRGFRALADSVDYLFLNEQEALLYARSRSLNRAIAVWRRRPGATIVKLGAAGSRWLGPAIDLHVPVKRRKPRDATGAGDAFNGAFLAAIARGQTAADCLRLANRVGAAATQWAGGLPVAPGRSQGG